MRHRTLAMLLLCLLAAPLPAVGAEDRPPPEPVGTWRGELGQGLRDRPLQLMLRIRQDKDGYIATLDGLGGALRHLTLEGLVLVEDVLSFQVPQVNGRFAGNFYGDSLRGTWSRGEASWPLIFFRD